MDVAEGVEMQRLLGGASAGFGCLLLERGGNRIGVEAVSRY